MIRLVHCAEARLFESSGSCGLRSWGFHGVLRFLGRPGPGATWSWASWCLGGEAWGSGVLEFLGRALGGSGVLQARSWVGWESCGLLGLLASLAGPGGSWEPWAFKGLEGQGFLGGFWHGRTRRPESLGLLGVLGPRRLVSLGVPWGGPGRGWGCGVGAVLVVLEGSEPTLSWSLGVIGALGFLAVKGIWKYGEHRWVPGSLGERLKAPKGS